MNVAAAVEGVDPEYAMGSGLDLLAPELPLVDLYDTDFGKQFDPAVLHRLKVAVTANAERLSFLGEALPINVVAVEHE